MKPTFQPAAGYRNGTSVSDASSIGYYWSASAKDSNNSYTYRFGSNFIERGGYQRHFGRSVRPGEGSRVRHYSEKDLGMVL